MGGYFIGRQMAPFGPSSLLTVDLGQQYVDFFAYLRAALLHHPTSLFYSFSKGLGGEMWGTNAYYLFSPLNLLLLFFPGRSLTAGIMLILLLRYGLAGLNFAWLLDKTGWQAGPRIWAFSTAYAMNGWMIANQLNMLWLDALVILPLIIWGLLKLLHHGQPGTYIAWLAVMMVDNYYMAWMICLFTVLVVAGVGILALRPVVSGGGRDCSRHPAANHLCPGPKQGNLYGKRYPQPVGILPLQDARKAGPGLL